jgi:hypothetical protein
VRSYPSWIAGLRYRGPDGINRGKYCLRLRGGDPLDLVREPENKYDQDAIAIKHNGCHLGYVPSRHHWVAEALGEGHQLSCAVARMETEGWLFRRVSFVGIRISIDDDGRADAKDTVVAKTIELRARDACIDGLVLNIALQISELGDDPKNIKTDALQRISKAGKVKGCI